ncbi:cobalamin biosynthesis Mg chelatase CobN [Kroppenstedtia sanguinis]|uniref:LPXTG cell wall anchor domain-containing protein n=1 Tax=Kroppenstedtia sanguinis TaxID=1380684 RepID=A0ABW4C4H3_9BACL
MAKLLGVDREALSIPTKLSQRTGKKKGVSSCTAEVSKKYSASVAYSTTWATSTVTYGSGSTFSVTAPQFVNNGDGTEMHNFGLPGILILVVTLVLVYFVLRSLIRKR